MIKNLIQIEISLIMQIFHFLVFFLFLQPIAMVAWASFYADTVVNETASERWIKNNAMKAPASHVMLNGQYNLNLLRPAKMVSDPLDSQLCPKTHVKVI